MLVWLRKQVRRLGEVSRGWCRPDWGNKRWASESGEYIRCMPPWGVLHLLFVAVKLGPKCSLQMHKGGERQLNIPLNLLFYCRNVLRQPLLPHQAERRERHWGQKGIFRLFGVFTQNLNSQILIWCFFRIYFDRHTKFCLQKCQTLFFLNFDERKMRDCSSLFCSPKAKGPGDGLILNGPEKYSFPSLSTQSDKGQVKHRWNIKRSLRIYIQNVSLCKSWGFRGWDLMSRVSPRDLSPLSFLRKTTKDKTTRQRIF